MNKVKFYIQHGWDTKYLVHPDRHNKKIYSQATIENNSSFLESLFSHPPPAGYTSYLDGVPVIDDGDIHQYFLVKCDDNSATAKKHRDTGWTFFKSGKVISSEFKMDIDESVLLLRGNVEASFDRGIITGKTKKHYFTYVCCDKHSGTILGGRCFCKAGLGGYCKHVAAVLFHVMDSQRQGYKFTPKGGSKTSNLQTWHQPKVKGRTCIKFSDLAFESFNFERENDCSTAKKQKTDYKNLSSCPDEDLCVHEEEIETFSSYLSALGVAEQFTEILNANDHQPAFQCPPQKTDTLHAVEEEHSNHVKTCFNLEHTVSPDQHMFYERNVCVKDISHQMDISSKTKGQAKTKKWMEERCKRITASNFKKVCNRRKYPCEEFVTSLSKPKQFKSVHTAWGHQAEGVTLVQYKSGKTREGFTVVTKDLGLVVNPQFPYLGASPDAFVTLTSKADTCTEFQGLVEVKSLSKYSEITPEQASCMPDSFYDFDDGQLKIKEDHSYYYQIQGQLAVCDVEWCDLVVWTPVEMAVQRVMRNRTFWSSIFPKLTSFYFEHMLPLLARNED